MTDLFSGIFKWYSDYSGTGILMVLYFVALIYLALKDENRSNRTILLVGSIVLIMIIFLPVTYFLYTKYVDSGTYWRMFWLIPSTAGLAYVGAHLINEHRVTGLFMIFGTLLLGGAFVYTSKPEMRIAENAYQIPDSVIEISDYLESRELDEIRVAVSPELLIYIRQYDVNLIMPYGREQLDPRWSEASGFFQLMLEPAIDFEEIAKKCLYNQTRFIVVNNEKMQKNNPAHNDFEYIMTSGSFDLYEYKALD